MRFVVSLAGWALLLVSLCYGGPSGAKITNVVGPVSQYGELIAGRIDGKGRIYGSCEGVSAGNEVQLKGMSLYWSLKPEATEFYSKKAVASMVKELKVQIIRLAIATDDDWGAGIVGYIKDPEPQLALIRTAVEAAVENDIYVIIDWHSHRADEQLNESKKFFETVSREFGHVDNVIFEIFNEPEYQNWLQVRSYSEEVIPVIRQYSDNLILVGSPRWDQNPNWYINREVRDSKKNIAYTFHFYAESHHIKKEGHSAKVALEAGLPLFVSEWGVTGFDSKKIADEESIKAWHHFLDENQISSLSWSASKINELSAAFLPESSEQKLVLSESGKIVKKLLSANPDRYKKCKHK